jgi:dTDP-4-dehydrorhamnose 3,5-epimerase-like enzyme
MNTQSARFIDLPRVNDRRGNLTFVENERQIPFTIQRVYYLYDVPGGETRAGHALSTTMQFLVAASGSFDVNLDDGRTKRKFSLNRSYFGLYVPPMLWRELDNFSSGAVCLALVSSLYDPNEYYRDYAEFCQARSQSDDFPTLDP